MHAESPFSCIAHGHFFLEIESEVEGGMVLTTFFSEVIHRSILYQWKKKYMYLVGGDLISFSLHD